MSPIEKIARYLDRSARDWLDEAQEELLASGASPIEAAFFLALASALKVGDYFRLQLREADDTHQCGVEPEKQVERFRVDFVISVLDERSGKRSLLAVECDGHEFHERTKDQAKKDRARDRRLQELGYTVYRFTGSEIHNDPVACAETVVAWLEAKSWLRP